MSVTPLDATVTPAKKKTDARASAGTGVGTVGFAGAGTASPGAEVNEETRLMALGSYLNKVVRSVPVHASQSIVSPAVWAADASRARPVVHTHEGADTLVRRILRQMGLRAIEVQAQPCPPTMPTTFVLDDDAARTERVPRLLDEWFE